MDTHTHTDKGTHSEELVQLTSGYFIVRHGIYRKSFDPFTATYEPIVKKDFGQCYAGHYNVKK